MRFYFADLCKVEPQTTANHISSVVAFQFCSLSIVTGNLHRWIVESLALNIMSFPFQVFVNIQLVDSELIGTVHYGPLIHFWNSFNPTHESSLH